MTLRDLIRAQIAADGPMRLDAYMATCLMHPDHGYYATRDPFGMSGDFVTAPEISQMFGEVLGLALAQTWIDQGKRDVVLVELGPGRGTLARDVLRVMRQVGLKPHVHLVETSATLRNIQRDTLGDAGVTHHNDVSTLPHAPTLLLANEFFDALPIRQFIRAASGWSERRITAQGDILAWAQTEDAPFPPLDHRLDDTKPGDLVEYCPTAGPTMSALTQIIADHGGAAIIVDYGDWRSLGDTFQALENHAPTDPLAHPGAADLTAHVDFEALSLAAHPRAQVSQMTPQGVILERLGITARAHALAQDLGGARLDAHVTAHRRLTHPDEMGKLFKMLAFTSPGAQAVAGFDF